MARPDEKLLAALTHASFTLAILSSPQSSFRHRGARTSQAAAASIGDVPPWQMGAMQDHVQKLFWCLYGMGRVQDIIDQRQFFEKREAAADIHAIRLLGLYVENADTGLNVPSKAITAKQSQSLLSLAEILVTHAEGATHRKEIPQEEIDFQMWFLSAFDDPDRRKRILTKQSFEKLSSLNDVVVWTRQLKADIERGRCRIESVGRKGNHAQPWFAWEGRQGSVENPG